MESRSEQLPLKVCRHCSVASRTESDTCPSCGQSYTRRGLQWRWWFAIPIVAAAFALGYFGLSGLVYDDDDDGGVVTAEEAGAFATGTPRSDVEDALGEPSETADGPGPLACDYYAIEGEPDQAWEFCFQGDVLASSRATGLPSD